MTLARKALRFFLGVFDTIRSKSTWSDVESVTADAVRIFVPYLSPDRRRLNRKKRPESSLAAAATRGVYSIGAHVYGHQPSGSSVQHGQYKLLHDS
jgi:hypothetical protein